MVKQRSNLLLRVRTGVLAFGAGSAFALLLTWLPGGAWTGARRPALLALGGLAGLAGWAASRGWGHAGAGAGREPTPAALPARGLHAQRMQLVGTYAGSIAHDCVNHLSVALLNLQAQKGAAEAGGAPALDRAYRAVAFCTRLAKGLLAFSRTGDAAEEPVDLNEVLEDAVLLSAPMMGRGVAIQCQLHPRLPLVVGNTLQLQQLFINLFLNGAEAMAFAGRLVVHTQVLGSQVLVRVRDSGCGIADQIRPRIFDPFFTTKGQERGHGLGLAIVKQTVDRMGGQIDLESHPGAGTEFRITFPGVAEVLTDPNPAESGA